MQEALVELAAWLDAHPRELVIISCSHFESLTDRDHADLVEFIIGLFGEKLCCSQVSRKFISLILALGWMLVILNACINRKLPLCARAGPDVSRPLFPMRTSRWRYSTLSCGLRYPTGKYTEKMVRNWILNVYLPK